MSGRAFPPIETDPKLLELLEKAKHHVMSKEEREAQRMSWSIGELMLSHPEMTRDEAIAIYRSVAA